MHLTTRTKITLLFTLIIALIITVQNTLVFETADREWQYKQKDYVDEVMKGMYAPDEAKAKFTHLEIIDGSGRTIHTQWVFASGILTPKSSTLFFPDRGLYTLSGRIYFITEEPIDGVTLRMAEDFSNVIMARDTIVEKSLWISIFGLLAVLGIGYFFSGYIMKPVKSLHIAAERFSLGKKWSSHETGIKWHKKDEVVMLARSLESLFARVRSEATKLEEFSDDIAHEVKNSLFSIGSSLDVALHTSGREEAIRKAKKTITELSSLVDSLLFFARSEDVKLEKTNIEKLLMDHLDLSDSRIHLELDAKVSLPVQRELFTTAVRNILHNAQKFTPEDGRIDIILTKNILEIRDTGKGISPDVIGKIFDRLWKWDTSRTSGSGYGLGLAISRKIVEDLHGYSLTVESEEGKGSTFRIEW
jgi:signal transduction histidine kinase